MQESLITTSVFLKDDEVITISKKIKDRSNKPVFLMIGSSDKIRNRIPGFPLMETMLDFNKEEQWFFKLLLDNMHRDSNICDVSHIEFTSTEVSKVSRAFVELKKIGLVKRFKKGFYMINPTAIIPPNTYEVVQERWDLC